MRIMAGERPSLPRNLRVDDCGLRIGVASRIRGLQSEIEVHLLVQTWPYGWEPMPMSSMWSSPLPPGVVLP
jgi:hypothetical protein